MRKIYVACMLLVLPCLFCTAQNKAAFSIPFTLVDNRPFIAVNINQHVFHFILDCGADYGLDLQTAKTLNLNPGHKTMQGGAGAKLVPTWTIDVAVTQIGTVTIRNARYLVTDFSEIKNNLHLPYLDGIIGYTFMKDYAVQFDYPNRMINFYRSYTGVAPVPFTLYYGSIPKINAEIDGIKAIVIIDTGDRTAFTLFNHFAIEKGLVSRYKLSDTSITGYGMGGPIYARRFTLGQLQIGKLKLAKIPSRIPMLKSGAFTDTSIDGSIGGGILKQYKFTIDYKKQVLYFE